MADVRLERLAAWISATRTHGRSAVVTCSALRRAYRDVLRAPDVLFVHLTAPAAVLADRLRERSGHFMSPDLLTSQLVLLEPPEEDELAFSVDVSGAMETTLTTIVEECRRAVASMQ